MYIPPYFQLKFINRSHFEDVVEERAIISLCGYPLCGHRLTSTVAKQYHISTKLNKVYDITERKNFCSNYCYAAAKFLAKQLLTSPLWIHDKEEIPTFKLLPSTVYRNPAGEEVDLGVIRLDAAEKQRTAKPVDEAEKHSSNIAEIEEASDGYKDVTLSSVVQEPAMRSVVLRIETCLQEWFTVHTVELLLGEDMCQRLQQLDITEETGPVLPLVDLHAQNALRRRIVLDRLNRVIL
uniref:RNA polymerase II subunit B1 CTD phosphatase RPAP2 homolog n=1 Tax=Timema poppense TaxID=170557 RepID=A0A7R9DF53_TIMPO|nr:unnamed protein product [Timema poppensis]